MDTTTADLWLKVLNLVAGPILKKKLYLFCCMGSLSACMSVDHMWCHGGQRGALDLLELELKTVVKGIR